MSVHWSVSLYWENYQEGICHINPNRAQLNPAMRDAKRSITIFSRLLRDSTPRFVRWSVGRSVGYADRSGHLLAITYWNGPFEEPSDLQPLAATDPPQRSVQQAIWQWPTADEPRRCWSIDESRIDEEISNIPISKSLINPLVYMCPKLFFHVSLSLSPPLSLYFYWCFTLS